MLKTESPVKALPAKVSLDIVQALYIIIYVLIL